MAITYDNIYRGCLIASIAHAIMTNVYPDLCYEQSWDNKNYSIQDIAGMRGTISFSNEICVGAIRNENVSPINQTKLNQILSYEVPQYVRQLASQETLQYLLIKEGNLVFPSVSCIFWADHVSLYYPKGYYSRLENDFILFRRIVLPEAQAIEEWRTYYDMDDHAVALLHSLIEKKALDDKKAIILSKEQQKLIPGGVICKECSDAFREMNIIC